MLNKTQCIHPSTNIASVITKVSKLTVALLLRRSIKPTWLLILILVSSSCADPLSESRGMFAHTVSGHSNPQELQQPPTPRLLIQQLTELEKADAMMN